ncbi:MAG: hypothetical protein HKN05_11860 [Rhizobiales bacterium]|nr:hypothetical protein [Hyphomicrobiales bacterium]
MTDHPAFNSAYEQPRPALGAHKARMILDTRLCAKTLFIVAVVLTIVGAFANIVIYQIADTPQAGIARVMSRFDLGHEPSLPAWFSSMVLLLNSAMLILISRAKSASADPFTMHWLALGLIFLGLSIDEAVMFHEMIDKLISFGVSTNGFLLFPWAVVGLGFALVVFFAYYKFLANLPLRFATLFIASGSLFVGGAVGMEFLAGNIIDQYGVASIFHTIVQTIEEGLEMAGSILFFYTLTEYWVWSYGPMGLKTAELGKL